jgi:hypothetical protein
VSLLDEVLREVYPETPAQLERIAARAPSRPVPRAREWRVLEAEQAALDDVASGCAVPSTVGVCLACGEREQVRFRRPGGLPVCAGCLT